MRGMKTLIKKELTAIAEKHGDARRSPLVRRDEARAFSELELMSADPDHRGALGKGLDPRCQGARCRPGHIAQLQVRRRFKLAARGTQQPVGGDPRFHGPRLHAGYAQPALCPGPG
jgi:topoisomerase-4 subunit A